MKTKLLVLFAAILTLSTFSSCVDYGRSDHRHGYYRGGGGGSTTLGSYRGGGGGGGFGGSFGGFGR